MSRIELDATDAQLIEAIRRTRDDIAVADWDAAPARARSAAIGRLLGALDMVFAVISDGLPATDEPGGGGER